LLAAAGFAESPVFPVSSRTGEGIAALARHLQKSAQLAGRKRTAASPMGLFRMPIDRAFTLPGIGLVVTGAVAAGRVMVGEHLTISPSGSFTGNATNVPNPNISRMDFTGTGTSQKITINYTITFTAAAGGGTAVGVLTLNHVS